MTDFFISRNLLPEEVLAELETQSLSVNAIPFKPSNKLTIETDSKLSTNAPAFKPPTLQPQCQTAGHLIITHMKARHSNIPTTRISTTRSLKTKMIFTTTITYYSPPHPSLTSPTANQSPLCSPPDTIPTLPPANQSPQHPHHPAASQVATLLPLDTEVTKPL